MVSIDFELSRMMMYLAFSLMAVFHVLSFILAAVLHFLLDNVNYQISDGHKSMFLAYFSGLAAVATLFAGPCISFLMISSYGPSIEKLITFVMDGNNTSEKEEDGRSQNGITKTGCLKKNKTAGQIRSPNKKIGLDEPLPIPAGDTGKLAVNNEKMIIVSCAFTVIQIFVYIMGHLAAVELKMKLSRMAGGLAVMSWSMFLASVFKLFSASHRYSSTMAKLVLAQSCVFEVFAVLVGARDWSIFYFFEIGCGAICIFVVISVMWNPVDKLYTFNSLTMKKPTYNVKVELQRNPVDKLYTFKSPVTKKPTYRMKV